MATHLILYPLSEWLLDRQEVTAAVDLLLGEILTLSLSLHVPAAATGVCVGDSDLEAESLDSITSETLEDDDDVPTSISETGL